MRISVAAAAALTWLTMGTPAIAQTAPGGSGYLQFWQCRQDTVSTLNTAVAVTNTSAVDLNLAITFYGMNGAVVSSGLTYTNFSGSVIPAGHTILVSIACVSQNFGVAKIEWSGAQAQKPLLAYGIRSHNQTTGITQHAVPVNNNMPF